MGQRLANIPIDFHVDSYCVKLHVGKSEKKSKAEIYEGKIRQTDSSNGILSPSFPFDRHLGGLVSYT